MAEHFRQWQIIELTSDPERLTFKPGNEPVWPFEYDLAPGFAWPTKITDALTALLGAAPTGAEIRFIGVYYLYVNDKGQVVEKDVALSFRGMGWSSLRPETLEQRDEFLSHARAYLDYNGLMKKYHD